MASSSSTQNAPKSSSSSQAHYPPSGFSSPVHSTSSSISHLTLPSSSSSSLSSSLSSVHVIPPVTEYFQRSRDLEHDAHHQGNIVHIHASNHSFAGTDMIMTAHHKIGSTVDKKHQRPLSSSEGEHRKQPHVRVCCSYASRFTLDCAVICCCPLSILHLAALAFIKFPISVARRMLVQLKSRGVCIRYPSTEDVEDDKVVRTRKSVNEKVVHVFPAAAHMITFDSQKLWQHFRAGELDFGGL